MNQKPEHDPNDCCPDDSQKHITHHTMSDGDLNFLPMYNISALELSLPTARRVSRIGYILSLSTLIVSFSILVGIRSLRCQRNKLHLHLFVSFMIRALMFLVADGGLLDDAAAGDINFIGGGVQITEITDKAAKASPVCKIFVSMWLYAIMANYSWILMEGLYLHNLIFLALMAPTLSITRYIVLGWGFPVPFLMSWIVLSSTSQSMLCWTESLNPAYFWIIRGPITASIITNFILFLNITRVVYLKTFAPQSSRHSRFRNIFRSTFILLPMFGVHYTITTVISTILEKNKKDELTWLQLDQVFSSFQGSVIALLCCFLNSEVQTALWSIWVKWKTTCAYLFAKRNRKCRKHSRARLTSDDAQSNPMGKPSIASSSGRCHLCAQETHDTVLCQSQETVVSFLDLEVKTEERAINRFYNPKSTISVSQVQSTSCQVHEESFVPSASVSSIAALEHNTPASTQSPSTPLLEPTESSFFKAKIHDGDSVIEITSEIDNLELQLCEVHNQTFALPSNVRFSQGSRTNFPCCYGIIAEESSLESKRILSDIKSESMHQVSETITTPPTCGCLPAIPQNECCFHDSNDLIQTSTPNTQCNCQNARINTSEVHSSLNFAGTSKFHYVVTDFSPQTLNEVEFTDGAAEIHHSGVELTERVKTSMSFLKPQVNEDESNLNIFDDVNESRLPLCAQQSTMTYRERSRSEGARWFRSIKKSKVSKRPPEWMKQNRSDPVIVFRSAGHPSVQLVGSPLENSDGFRQNHAQQENKTAKLESRQAGEGKICPEHYQQFKTRCITDQSFRPRSSSYCCRPTHKRQRNRETSPRIPPEWMTKNTNLISGKKLHLGIGSDRNSHEQQIPSDSSHNSQLHNDQGKAHRITIISSQDDQSVENENIMAQKFIFGTDERKESSVPKSA